MSNEKSYCSYCRRPLTDALSIKLGAGKQCRKKKRYGKQKTFAYANYFPKKRKAKQNNITFTPLNHS
jgi:hypothetical protein